MTRAATGSAATAHSMKRTVRRVHKYLSLGLLVLWLLQAVTGVLLVFHWELDDLGVAGPRVALNPYKLDTALERFQQEHPGQPVNAIYTSGDQWRASAQQHLSGPVPGMAAKGALAADTLALRRYHPGIARRQPVSMASRPGPGARSSRSRVDRARNRPRARRST